MQKLQELLLQGIQSWSGISQDPDFLVHFDSLKKTVAFIEAEPEAKYAASELRRIFGDKNWAGNTQSKESFFQLVGEVQFWMLAREKGLVLQRVVGKSGSLPDFRLADAISPCFEVKTPSIVGGNKALDTIAEQLFEGELNLQQQILSGKQIAMHEQLISPYGAIPSGREQTTVCRKLLDKIENNIKLKQYDSGITFLVINMIRIGPGFTDNRELKPLSTGWPHDYSRHTGVLWTIGFGQLEQGIEGEPHFEGHSNIEGRLERQGILVNPQFASIAGLLFVIHPMREQPRIYGIWKQERFACWERSQPNLSAALKTLVGNNWNDEGNSNSNLLNEMP